MKNTPPKYALSMDLPFPVDEEQGAAKFDKSRRCLTVSLPVKAGPLLKAERLSSNDSGIDAGRCCFYFRVVVLGFSYKGRYGSLRNIDFILCMYKGNL